MTIYNQISNNRIRSGLIMVVFVLLLTGFFFLIGKFFNGQGYFIIGLVVSLLSAVGSYFYSDRIVLWMNRAQPADKRTFFDFYTVTENLAIADGVPMPKIYVIDDQAPNAFATGRDPKHAVVCATTGLLNKLDRSEIEGVISHELSHVKNYDILFASLVAVLVGTVAFTSDWIMRSLWWGGIGGRNDDRDRRNPLMLIGMIVALILIPIAATLIQLAVSRQREFLADASGALLTRNPEGLASALEKIGSDPTRFAAANNATAHLFISNPLKNIRRGSWIAGLFSTHPPIEERARLLRSM